MELEQPHEDEGVYHPTLVNIERIMWISPMQDGTCRLYMNVADDEGKPATLDVLDHYDAIKQLLTAKGEYDAYDRKEDGRQDQASPNGSNKRQG